MLRERPRSGGRFAPSVYVGAEAPTPWWSVRRQSGRFRFIVGEP
jgi:hypothetical protein